MRTNWLTITLITWVCTIAIPVRAVPPDVARSMAEANAAYRSGDYEQALTAYTRNGALLMHQEDDTGTLEAGNLADLVVLDRNLFEIEPAQINEARVLRTYLGGRQVYPR